MTSISQPSRRTATASAAATITSPMTSGNARLLSSSSLPRSGNLPHDPRSVGVGYDDDDVAVVVSHNDNHDNNNNSSGRRMTSLSSLLPSLLSPRHQKRVAKILQRQQQQVAGEEEEAEEESERDITQRSDDDAILRRTRDVAHGPRRRRCHSTTSSRRRRYTDNRDDEQDNNDLSQHNDDDDTMANSKSMTNKKKRSGGRIRKMLMMTTTTNTTAPSPSSSSFAAAFFSHYKKVVSSSSIQGTQRKQPTSPYYKKSAKHHKNQNDVENMIQLSRLVLHQQQWERQQEENERKLRWQQKTIMYWMTCSGQCPIELVPKIISYLGGPRLIQDYLQQYRRRNRLTAYNNEPSIQVGTHTLDTYETTTTFPTALGSDSTYHGWKDRHYDYHDNDYNNTLSRLHHSFPSRPPSFFSSLYENPRPSQHGNVVDDFITTTNPSLSYQRHPPHRHYYNNHQEYHQYLQRQEHDRHLSHRNTIAMDHENHHYIGAAANPFMVSTGTSSTMPHGEVTNQRSHLNRSTSYRTRQDPHHHHNINPTKLEVISSSLIATRRPGNNDHQSSSLSSSLPFLDHHSASAAAVNTVTPSSWKPLSSSSSKKNKPRKGINEEIYDYWSTFLSMDSIWKAFGEEYNKWDCDSINLVQKEQQQQPEDDEYRNEDDDQMKSPPMCCLWKHYYYLHPIIGLDFDTIHEAVSYATYIVQCDIQLRQEYHYMKREKARAIRRKWLLQQRHVAVVRATTTDGIVQSDDTTRWYQLDDSCRDDDTSNRDDDDMNQLMIQSVVNRNDHTVVSLTHQDKDGGDPYYSTKPRSSFNKKNPPTYSLRILCQVGMIHYLYHAISVPINDNITSVSIETWSPKPKKGSDDHRDWAAAATTSASPFDMKPIQTMAIVRSNATKDRNRRRLKNEPLFHLLYGTLKIDHVSLHHECGGIDIWSGNSAIFIGSSLVYELTGTPMKMTSLQLNAVDIVSKTGRGIVAIPNDLGSAVTLDINNSCIRSCAATGLYLAGCDYSAGYHASMYCSISNTDIIGNGIGSHYISRGHSGIYIERGRQSVLLSNCNISHNTTSGICFFFANESLSLFHNSTELLADLRISDDADDRNRTNRNNEDITNQPRLHGTTTTMIANNSNNPRRTVIGGNHTSSSLRQRQQIRFCMNDSSIVLNQSEQIQVTAETLQFHVHQHHHLNGRINDHRTMLEQLFDDTNNELSLLPSSLNDDQGNHNDTVRQTESPKPRSTILSTLQQHHSSVCLEHI